MKKFTKTLCLILYYCFARHLPSSSGKFMGGGSKYLRYFLCKRIFEYCGKNVNIERKASFGNGSHVRIGDNSGLGVNCIVPNNIQIGSDVMMAPNCVIFYQNHETSRLDIPMNKQGVTPPKQVIIADDVWIGQNVMIMPGIHIAKGTIVAAGTVLCKDFPEYSVVGGNPSKLIKVRKNDTN